MLISTTPGGDDLPGPVEALFGSGPEPPDWDDRAAVVRYLVELERPYGGRAFDEELMTRVAERTVDHAADLAGQLKWPFEVEEGDRRARDQLGAIDAPTVVVHGTDDPMFPIEHGRALAGGDPGARLLALDGFGHAHRAARVLARAAQLSASAVAARGRASAANVTAQATASAR